MRWEKVTWRCNALQSYHQWRCNAVDCLVRFQWFSVVDLANGAACDGQSPANSAGARSWLTLCKGQALWLRLAVNPPYLSQVVTKAVGTAC